MKRRALLAYTFGVIGRWCALLTLAACGRYGFGDVPPTNGDGGDDDAGPDADAIAHVTVDVTGRGAVRVAGLWCTDHCAHDLPIGTALDVMAVPRDGSMVLADTSTCPGDCTTLAGDASIAISFGIAPITANRIFVSSTTLAMPFGGLGAADAFCQARADALSLGGTFVAMLSTSSTNMRDRLAGSRGWVRLDGVSVLDQPTDIWTEQINPISVDETGAAAASVSGVYTGTNDAGAVFAGRTCGDWAVTTGSGEIRNTSWSGATVGVTSGGGCSLPLPLFCAETGKQVALAPTPWPFGRYVFTSGADWRPDQGLASADALCSTEAAAAGLPGTYKALLADVGVAATSRFTSLAGPWRRSDDVLVTLGDLGAGPVDAPLNRDARGELTPNSRVWVGSSNPTLPGDVASTCDGWTDKTSGATGSMHRAFDIKEWISGGGFPCTNTPVGVYCVQE